MLAMSWSFEVLIVVIDFAERKKNEAEAEFGRRNRRLDLFAWTLNRLLIINFFG